MHHQICFVKRSEKKIKTERNSSIQKKEEKKKKKENTRTYCFYVFVLGM